MESDLSRMFMLPEARQGMRSEAVSHEMARRGLSAPQNAPVTIAQDLIGRFHEPTGQSNAFRDAIRQRLLEALHGSTDQGAVYAAPQPQQYPPEAFSPAAREINRNRGLRVMGGIHQDLGPEGYAGMSRLGMNAAQHLADQFQR
jgi:hypothetical protein